MSAQQMAVEIEGLTKSFGSVHALRGLDLTVPTGVVRNWTSIAPIVWYVR